MARVNRQTQNNAKIAADKQKGPLVVDARVLFAVISSEPGLCCCLPSDSPRSVDISLLFVHCKAVHFPRIKSAFTRVCQDVFGAYLQLLSESESRGLCSGAEGGRLLCALSVFSEGENWLKGCQRTWKHTSIHTHIHRYTHTHTHRRAVFLLSAALAVRTKCLK